MDGKQFKEAESWFTRALEIQSRKLPAGHEKILPLEFSSDLFQYQGNYAKARQMLEELLRLRGKPGKGTSTDDCREPQPRDDPCYPRRENWSPRAAREFLNLLSDNLENVLAYFPENRRLGFVQNMGFSPYDLAATLGDGPLTADAVLTFKAAVLESVARDRRRALLSRGSDNARLVEQINELRQQFLEAQLAGKTHRTRDLAAALEEKEKELSRGLREDGTYRPLQQVAWKDVASRLPVDAVLLEFVFYKKHLGGKGGWRGWCGAVALAREREPVFRELGPSDEILKSIGGYLDVAAGELRILFNANFNTPANASGASSHEEPNRRITEVADAAALNAKIERACRDLFDRLSRPLPMSCRGMAPSYSSALMAGSALSASRRCSIITISSSGAASKYVTLTAGGYFLSDLSCKKGSRIRSFFSAIRILKARITAPMPSPHRK